MAEPFALEGIALHTSDTTRPQRVGAANRADQRSARPSLPDSARSSRSSHHCFCD